jgi:hypothetical protein
MLAPVPARPPLDACAGLRERDLLSIRDLSRSLRLSPKVKPADRPARS